MWWIWVLFNITVSSNWTREDTYNKLSFKCHFLQYLFRSLYLDYGEVIPEPRRCYCFDFCCYLFCHLVYYHSTIARHINIYALLGILPFISCWQCLNTICSYSTHYHLMVSQHTITIGAGHVIFCTCSAYYHYMFVIEIFVYELGQSV